MKRLKQPNYTAILQWPILSVGSGREDVLRRTSDYWRPETFMLSGEQREVSLLVKVVRIGCIESLFSTAILPPWWRAKIIWLFLRNMAGQSSVHGVTCQLLRNSTRSTAPPQKKGVIANHGKISF
jgi:hypothetical protein